MIEICTVIPFHLFTKISFVYKMLFVYMFHIPFVPGVTVASVAYFTLAPKTTKRNRSLNDVLLNEAKSCQS